MLAGPLIIIGMVLLTGLWAISLIVLAVMRGRGWLLTLGAAACLLVSLVSAVVFVGSLEPGFSPGWRVGAGTLAVLMLGGAAALTVGVVRKT